MNNNKSTDTSFPISPAPEITHTQLAGLFNDHSGATRKISDRTKEFVWKFGEKD